jgi:hypothetical protein
MTIALKSKLVVKAWGLKEPFQGNCFSHVMSKACQYKTTNDKVCCGAEAH